MKRPLFLWIVALLLAGGWMWAGLRDREAPDAETAPASPASALPEKADALVEVGVLEAEILAAVPSRNQGIVAEVIDDGTRVQTGDLLVRLDDEEIRNNLESEKENLEQQRENLEAERHEMSVITNQYQSVARLERAERDHARLRLKKARIPLTPEESRLHEIDIELARLDLRESQALLDRQRELVERRFAPASSLDPLQRDVEAAQTFLDEKESRFELAKKPLPREERLPLESEVRKAEETVRRSLDLHKQEVAIQQLKIEGLRLNVRNSEEKIERLRDKLDAVRITAPTNGVFLLIRKYSWGARRWEPLSVGERIWGMNRVGHIVDPDDLHVRMMLHESDVGRVRPGDSATVTLSAFPGQRFPATVRTVTEMGQDRDDLSPLHRQAPPARQALFLAILDVELPANLEAMPGMTATVRLPGSDRP